jgi:primosomal protein N''
MQQKIYETAVQPKEETIQYLTGWSPPKGAYVLFETREWHLKSDGVRELGTGLMTLNAESRADIAHQVDFYLNKGFRILHYGNFPKFNDQNPARAAKAQHYSQGAGVNPWDALEKYVRMKMEADVNWKAEKATMQLELDALKQKLAAELAKKEKVAAAADKKEKA